MKKQLGVFDKNRLSELVSIHLDPPGEFTIYANGEVSMNKANWIQRKFNIRDDSTMDFLSVSQTISDKLMENEDESSLIHALCGEAIGILIDTNDREEVIKKLYLAHLADKDLCDKTLFRVGDRNSRPRVEVTRTEIIERRQPRVQKVQIYDNRVLRKSRAENIANAMNNADVIYIAEEE